MSFSAALDCIGDDRATNGQGCSRSDRAAAGRLGCGIGRCGELLSAIGSHSDVARRVDGGFLYHAVDVGDDVVSDNQTADAHRIGVRDVQSDRQHIDRVDFLPEAVVRIIGVVKIDQSIGAHVLIDQTLSSRSSIR